MPKGCHASGNWAMQVSNKMLVVYVWVVPLC